MKAEQQRIAIAEWMGFSEIENRNGWLFGRTKPYDCIVEIPNYPNDLNAMHEAEKKLGAVNSELWNTYMVRLADVVKEKYIDGRILVHAPAQQRCEALIRAIGKWTD